MIEVMFIKGTKEFDNHVRNYVSNTSLRSEEVDRRKTINDKVEQLT